MTLVELLVAMALGSVVLAAAVGIFVASMRSTRFVNTRTTTTADVRVAMEQLSRELRMATRPQGIPAAFTSAKKQSMAYYSLLDRGQASVGPNGNTMPVLVEYSYGSSCLNVGHTPTTYNTTTGWALNTAQKSTKCLLRTTATPNFTYYSSTIVGMESASTLSNFAVDGLNVTDRGKIASVQINMTGADVAAQDVQGIPMMTRVTLTNLVPQLTSEATQSYDIENGQTAPPEIITGMPPYFSNPTVPGETSSGSTSATGTPPPTKKTVA